MISPSWLLVFAALVGLSVYGVLQIRHNRRTTQELEEERARMVLIENFGRWSRAGQIDKMDLRDVSVAGPTTMETLDAMEQAWFFPAACRLLQKRGSQISLGKGGKPEYAVTREQLEK